ncbi:MAG: tetratricopeptide repeat protein [Candidatus Obscuribacterales bacterium]|nr:tetratricopeptide repeat protein [Candidatus Obscuribacterales bacterium]
MFDLLVSPRRFHFALFAAVLLSGTVLVGPTTAEENKARSAERAVLRTASDAKQAAAQTTAGKELGQAAGAKDTTSLAPTHESKSAPQAAAGQHSSIKTESSEMGDRAVLKDGKLVREVDPAAQQLAQTQALDHFDLSRFYFSQFDLKMCELELEAAIMYMPTMKAAHRDYCIVSLLTGHPLRSVAELMMVAGLGEPVPLTEAEKVELKARGAKLHYRKALEYGKKEKWDNSIAELQWALDFTPTNASIKRSLAFALASKGEFDMAEETYKDSLAADPDDPYAHADFAYLLSDKGEENKAFSQLAQAVQLAPQAAALHVDLAWMAETKGDFKLASDELEKAIKISPTHAGLWAHLGRVDERKGDVDGAIAAYNRALNVDPGQFEAKRRLEVIKAEDANLKSPAPEGDATNPAAPSAEPQSRPESGPASEKTKEPVKSVAPISNLRTSQKLDGKSL